MQVAPMERLTQERLEEMERSLDRYPFLSEEFSRELISEVRQLFWELENARKLAAYWKGQRGSLDGFSHGFRVVSSGG